MHKEHFDKKEDFLAPCKLNYDPNSAKELLILAQSINEQKLWVCRLSKKIQKSGYKANSSSNVSTLESTKVSPR